MCMYVSIVTRLCIDTFFVLEGKHWNKDTSRSEALRSITSMKGKSNTADKASQILNSHPLTIMYLTKAE